MGNAEKYTFPSHFTPRHGHSGTRYRDAFHSVGSEVKLNVSSYVRVYSPGAPSDLPDR